MRANENEVPTRPGITAESFGAVNRGFCFVNYSGSVANVIWSMGWTVACGLAMTHFKRANEAADLVDALVALVAAGYGWVVTRRAFRRIGVKEPEKVYPRESLMRRIGSWMGGLVWLVAGVIWNAAIWPCLFRAASSGNSFLVLLLVPFSLAAWFFLMLLTVALTMLLDALMKKVREIFFRPKKQASADGKYAPQP